jgi:hypothetical protein
MDAIGGSSACRAVIESPEGLDYTARLFDFPHFGV